MSQNQGSLLLAALLVVAGLVYVASGGFDLLSSDEDAANGEESGLMGADAAAGAPTDEDVVGLETTGRKQTDASSGGALPAPVDLEKVDRSRDLHGIVVRADDAPVGGAVLQSVYYPWRYGRLLTDGGHRAERLGPTTRSARDGTFALRLVRGDQVHLRTTAKGLATTELAMLQAGERIKVVLHEPVRLIAKALTPDGKPATGLEVRIFVGGRSAVSFERVGTTGAEGCFAFEDLPPGVSVYLDPQPRHEGWGDPGWIRIRLPDTGELTHEFTMPGGRTLTGAVTDASTGRPIEGARVGMNWVLTPETKTDAEGRYSLPGWSAKGVSDIHVLAEGYARAQVDVESKTVLDFALTPGASTSGRVVDGSGAPIEGAQVMAVNSDGGGDMALSMDHVWTDKEGRFILTGLTAGVVHVLTVIARGYAQGLRDIAVQAAGSDADLGDIVLTAPRSLIGTLRSSAKEPLARILINLRIEEPGKSGYRRGRAWERRTDDLGRFRFDDLPVARYTVSTRPKGGAGLRQMVQLLDREEPTEVAFVQEVLREVRVRVTDVEGKPVAAVYISAQGLGGRRMQAQTDGDGIALLHVHPGKITVRVDHAGEREFALPEPIPVGDDQSEVTFVLQPAAITTGTLLDPTGKALPWASLEVRRDGKQVTWAWTDEEGRFRITTGVGVVYSIVFEGLVGPSKKERYRTTQQPLEAVREGVRAGSTGVVLRATAIAADGSVTVRVLDPEGHPVENVYVQLDPAPPVNRTFRTDAEGRVKFEKLHVRSTRVTLWFQSTPKRPWLAPPPHQTRPDGQELVLRLRTGASIEGLLVHVGGAPVLGGTVSVVLGNRFVSSTRSDEDGRFVLVVDLNEAGPYTLRSAATGSDGTRLMAMREGVQPGEAGIVLTLAPPR